MANPIIQSIEEQLAKIREDVAGKQAQFQKVQQYGYQPQEQIIFNQSGDVMPRDIYPSIDSPSQEEQSIQKALFESQGGQYNPQSGGYNFTAPNQEDVYQRTMGLFQDQINALDQFYAQKKSEMTAQLAQKSYGELGQQRAILGSSGMLGQVSGMAQKAGLQGEQAGRLKTAIEGIEGEQNYKKSQLFGQVREMAQSEYQSKMSAFQEGVGGYLTYLKDKKSKQQENIGAIIQTALVNDIDLSKDDGWLSKYAQELGVKPGDIISQYTQKKSEFDAQQAEAQAQAEKEVLQGRKLEAEVYQLEHPEATTKEVQGGLYDVTNNRWIVPPKEEVVGGTGTADKVSAGTSDSNFFKEDDLTEVNNLLGGDSGLISAVGTNALGRGPTPVSGKKQNFIAGVEQLLSKLSLDALIKAKQEGATFGQLSDREMNILSAAASKIGTWRIVDKKGKVKGYQANEKDFKAELERIKELINKATISQSGIAPFLKSGVTASGLNFTIE